jgi:hypothetical protein
MRVFAWAFAHVWLRELKTDGRQLPGEQQDVVFTAKPGDRFKLVFTDRTFVYELRNMIAPLLSNDFSEMIEFDVAGRANLVAIFKKGEWVGTRECMMTMLKGYDPHIVGRVAICHGLVERIEKITA